MNLSVFKKYDIRGLVDAEITTAFAHALGRAFATLISREINAKKLTIVVGRDMRESSVDYQTALMDGLKKQGVSVLDIGLVSTPAFYFSVGHLKAHGGIIVSASHNPAEYNGFKLTRDHAIPVSGDSGIQTLARMMEASDFESKKIFGSVEKVEGIPELAAQAEYAFAKEGMINRLRVVADSGNGMGAQYLDALAKLIGIDLVKMFWDFDGRFPNHEPDPLKKENMSFVCEAVKKEKADLGIATDGDGDRIFFVDNNGEIVEPAIIRGLLGQIMLRKFPGATICYDVRPGKITEDLIRLAGGKPSQTRVGHSLIKEQMAKEGAVFGGESSGHFFYAFPNGIFEGPVTAMVQILQELTRRKMSFADMVRPWKRYAHSGEMNFQVENKDEVMKRIKARFSDGTLNELDGLSITYPDFWFNIRGSNTEAVLRFNLEAMNRETMEKRRDEIIQLITYVHKH